MEDPIIKVENLSKVFKLPYEKHSSLKATFINSFKKDKKGYELQKALENISFEIKKGDFFGIVGRNGSGKSTLLKLLAGIYTPTTGSVDIKGSLTPFIELGVGFNPELTGRENVFLNGALLGFNRKEIQEMYNSIVKFAELEKFMDQKLKNYSSGMQVRLAFSIAIQAHSDILLLDEVLAVGDAAFQQKCFNYFEELKQQNQTVVFVSHDMASVRRFCTRAVYVKNGKIIKEGRPEEIADIYVTENIATEKKSEEAGDKLSEHHRVEGKISQQTGNEVVLNVKYQTKDKDEVYVGISILRDGFSVAEIITSPNLHLKNRGELSYTLDTGILNSGVYQISMVLCRLKNRQLLSVGKEKPHFVIQGDDVTKGGALKLKDTWAIKK